MKLKGRLLFYISLQLFLTLSLGSADAAGPDFGPYMTLEGDTGQSSTYYQFSATEPQQKTDEFHMNDYIFSFIEFTIGNLLENPLFLTWKWYRDGALVQTDTYAIDADTYGVNTTLYLWDPLKNNNLAVGKWSVVTTWQNPGGDIDTGSQTLNFEVVPEPISSILFLAGGSSLFLIRRRKAKQQTNIVS